VGRGYYPERGDRLSTDDIQDLKNDIQQLRAKLKELTINHKLSDPEVLGASQILDALLVEYEKLLMKKK
jgi:hypothetical protein